MARGELAEGRIHPIAESAGYLHLSLRGIEVCAVLGHSTAWELWEEDQGHPIKSFGFSKKRTLILLTNARFSCLHGKISINLGKSLQAFLP